MKGFRSEKRAEFEAWIINGRVLPSKGPHQREGELIQEYEIVTLDQLKSMIQQKVMENDYAKVNALARIAQNEINFINKKITKSIRVPLNVYFKLIELALKYEVPLSGVLNNFIYSQLIDKIKKYEIRSDINRDKLKILMDALNDLKQIRSEYYTQSYILKLELNEKKIKKYLDESIDIWLEKFLYTYENKIPKEILEKYVELSYDKNIIEAQMESAYDLSIMYKNNRLNIISGWAWVLFYGNSSYRSEIVNEFGTGADTMLEEVVGKWVFDDNEMCDWFESENLFEDMIDVDSNGVIKLHDIPLEEIRNNKTKYIDIFTKKYDNLKNELQKSIMNSDYKKIEDISQEIMEVEDMNKYIEIYLEALIRANKGKSQVITIYVPEVVMAFWEAFGDVSFENIFSFNNLKGGTEGTN